jgi:hypothetical protein
MEIGRQAGQGLYALEVLDRRKPRKETPPSSSRVVWRTCWGQRLIRSWRSKLN